LMMWDSSSFDTNPKWVDFRLYKLN